MSTYDGRAKHYYYRHHEERKAALRAQYQKHKEERKAKMREYGRSEHGKAVKKKWLKARVAADPGYWSRGRDWKREYAVRTSTPDKFAKHYKQKAEWYARNSEKNLARKKAVPKEVQKKWSADEWRRHQLRCRTDAAYYALWRAKERLRYAQYRVAAGKTYSPRYSGRIPNWCVSGAVLDTKSRFIAVNITPSQKEWARRLFLERREGRAK